VLIAAEVKGWHLNRALAGRCFQLSVVSRDAQALVAMSISCPIYPDHFRPCMFLRSAKFERLDLPLADYFLSSRSSKHGSWLITNTAYLMPSSYRMC
jgi:hypothetical protein